MVILQKFVIDEFSQRHEKLAELHRLNSQRDEPVAIKRYWIDHTNMQSAQVNQLTVQLKSRVAEVRKFYGSMLTDVQREAVLGKGYVKY